MTTTANSGGSCVDAIRAHPGVTSVSLNHPLSRAVVDIDDPGFSLRDLCRTVEAAEKRCGEGKDESIFARSLPGDGVVLATRALTVAVNATGLGVALTGRALGLRPLPAAVSASVAFVDYQPWLRRVFADRLGGPTTDTVLTLAAAAAQTLTQSPTSLALGADHAVDESRRGPRGGPKLGAARTGAGAHADQPRMHPSPRPQPSRPVERAAGRFALLQALSAGAIGAGTRNLAMAATAVQVTTPKASRTTPEAFASTLGRGLADQHAVLPLRPESLRRLDKIDAIVIDPRILCTDTLRVARIRGADDSRADRGVEPRPTHAGEKQSAPRLAGRARDIRAASRTRKSKRFSCPHTIRWPRPSSPRRIAPGRN